MKKQFAILATALSLLILALTIKVVNADYVSTTDSKQVEGRQSAVPYSTKKTKKSKKKKKFKVYEQVIKEGNIAYCGGCGIYKVNLKTGKVTTLKKNKDWLGSRYTDMKKIGSWIYFKKDGETYNYLYRINVRNRKCKKIAPKILPYPKSHIGNLWYYISGSKIYLTTIYDGDYDGDFNAVTKLNGKGEKRSTRTIINRVVKKTSNAKGYRLIEKYNDAYYKADNGSVAKVKIWLKTPKKKYYLGKAKYRFNY